MIVTVWQWQSETRSISFIVWTHEPPASHGGRDGGEWKAGLSRLQGDRSPVSKIFFITFIKNAKKYPGGRDAKIQKKLGMNKFGW